MTEPTAVVHQRTAPPLAVDRWSFDELHKFAALLVRTRFLPESITTPEQALAIIMTGRELGIGPMHALRSIGVIKGKPTVSAELMLALFKRAGGRSLWEVSTEQVARITLRHPNGDEHVETFTMDDARQAGLAGKDMWKRYPKAMLRARALAAGLRAIAPDVIAGTYTAEELDADVAYGGDYGGDELAAPTAADREEAAYVAYLTKPDPDIADEATETEYEAQADAKGDPPDILEPTDKQRGFLNKLMQSHVWTKDEIAKVDKWREGLRSREEYSTKIDAAVAEIDRRKKAEQPKGETTEGVRLDIEQLMEAAPGAAVKLWRGVLDTLVDDSPTIMEDLQRVRHGLASAISDEVQERTKREHRETQRAALDG
jgi:hypothetical protein